MLVLVTRVRFFAYLSAVVTGGAGLFGVVGDGCSCFSIVSFTSSCWQKYKNRVWDSFVNTLHEEKEWHTVYLYSIQHRLDDAGHCDYAVFVVQVDAVQHHLVCPADEIAQTLIDAAVTRRQRRAADDDEG